MKSYLTLLLAFAGALLNAQAVVNFEEFNLPPESYLQNAGSNAGFTSGNIFLNNQYDTQYMSWSGWAISNTTDSTTPGFTNSFSAITGGGYNGSEHYAVTYDSWGNNNLLLTGAAAGQPVLGMYVTNSTYAYLSMLEGDDFSKKFGGVSGNDPDWFLLTIKKYYNGLLSTDSINFYLADYRFSDNSQDYIVDEWTWVDLSSLGAADSLFFVLNSSDAGMFGMNTPGFFCADNITVTGPSGTWAAFVPGLFEIYPNPSADFIQIFHSEKEIMDCAVFDLHGKLVLQKKLNAGGGQLDLRFLPAGNYIVHVQGKEAYSARVVVKRE